MENKKIKLNLECQEGCEEGIFYVRTTSINEAHYYGTHKECGTCTCNEGYVETEFDFFTKDGILNENFIYKLTEAQEDSEYVINFIKENNLKDFIKSKQENEDLLFDYDFHDIIEFVFSN